MKTWIAAALALGITAQTMAADPPSRADIKQLERDYATLSLWAFTPGLLIKRCEKEYPDELTQVRMGAMQWLTGQMERYEQVERRRGLLLAMLSKAAGQSTEKIDADFKRRVERDMVQGIFTDFSPEYRHQICLHLEASLPRIAAGAEEGLAEAMQRDWGR